MKIGYVGLGAMGGSLAKWLIAEHSLSCWDLNPAAVERFVALGAKAAASLPELARESDIILLCLPRSADVEDALFGKGGLAEGLSAGKLVIDQTSGNPEETRRTAARLEVMGVALVDAPVAGGVPAAQAGRITVMLSGPEAAQERALPVLRAMTSTIYSAGEQVGDAQAVKTLNNMMNMVLRIATLELAGLGVRLGLPLKDLTEAINGGIGANFSSRSHLTAVAAGGSTGSFALKLMLKDNNLAVSFGMAQGVPMLLSALARGVLQQNVNIEGPEAGLDDIIAFMAKATGADWRSAGKGLATADAAGTAATIGTALAACNRAAVYEILALAIRLGLDVQTFGRIANNASAWSREFEAVLAELSGANDAPRRSLSETVAALREVERLSAETGVPVLVAGAVRALSEAALRQGGAGATVDALAARFEQDAGVTFPR